MKNKIEQAFLVYQAGIANVFSVECLNLSPFGREAARIYQGDFRGAEMLCRGLILAGVPVGVASCNQAGDIANSKWTDGLEDCPFRESARPPSGHCKSLEQAISDL